jgi:hypothetical protein
MPAIFEEQYGPAIRQRASAKISRTASGTRESYQNGGTWWIVAPLS